MAISRLLSLFVDLPIFSLSLSLSLSKGCSVEARQGFVGSFSKVFGSFSQKEERSALGCEIRFPTISKFDRNVEQKTKTNGGQRFECYGLDFYDRRFLKFRFRVWHLSNGSTLFCFVRQFQTDFGANNNNNNNNKKRPTIRPRSLFFQKKKCSFF